MGSLKHKFRQAFAVDPPGAATPSPGQQVVVDRVCREVARRHLTTPGLVMLEVSRPLNYLGSQLMQFMSPAVWAVVRRETYEHYEQFAAFLERRGSIEYLARRIEHFEGEFERRAREAKASRRRGASTGPPDRIETEKDHEQDRS